MRKLGRLLLALAFALGASAEAGAAVATLVSGELGISIGALPPLTFQNQMSPMLDVSTGAGSFVEPASIFTGSIQVPTALFTGVPLIAGLTIGNLANGSKFINTANVMAVNRVGLMRPGNGNLGGPGPLTGSAFVNVLKLFNLTVPLGIVGNTNASTAVAAGTLVVTVLGTGWTVGQVQISGVTTGSPGENTVVNVGYDNRDAAHHGIIQLISPFKVITNAAGNLPGLATQTLSFVPEAGTILMLLSGVVTLGIGGWLRMRGR